MSAVELSPAELARPCCWSRVAEPIGISTTLTYISKVDIKVLWLWRWAGQASAAD